MAKSVSKEAELLGMMEKRLKRVTPGPKVRDFQASSPPSQAEQADSQKVERVLFSLHPEDRKTIQTLSAWFAGQGVNISHSMVIRSALRVARPGDELMTAYQEARKLDQRLKKTKKSK